MERFVKIAIKKVLPFALIYLLIVCCLFAHSKRVEQINNIENNQQTYYEYEVEHK